MKAADTPRVPLHGAPVWPLSLAAYHALGEAGLMPKNTELLYGFVYQKMSKSPLHSGLVRQLLLLLQAISFPGCFVSSEQPITCGDSEPEPDISIVRGPVEATLREHPKTAELVIEVCVSTHEYDRSKLRAYASAGVKEIWLVLVPEQQVEVYLKPANDEFAERKVHGPGGCVTSAALPQLTLELDAFFAK